MARCRATSHARSRLFRFVAIRLTQPRRRRRTRKSRRRSRQSAPRGAASVPRPSAVNANASSANTPLSLAPQAAQTAPAAEARTHLAATAPAAPSGGGYLVQVSSQRNEADAQASYRVSAGQVPNRAGIALAVDQTCRSRRKRGLLPRHGGSVRVLGRSVAILRQSEDCGRTVRHPKELTAVSLTLGPRAG